MNLIPVTRVFQVFQNSSLQNVFLELTKNKIKDMNRIFIIFNSKGFIILFTNLCCLFRSKELVNSKIMCFFVQPLSYGVKLSKQNNVKLANCRSECKKKVYTEISIVSGL